MKRDFEYLKGMLSAFSGSENACISLCDLIENVGASGGPTVNEKFVHHYSLLVDTGLITSSNMTSPTLYDMGISLEHGAYYYCDLDVALSKSGSDFLKLLNSQEVFDILESQFLDKPFQATLENIQKSYMRCFKNETVISASTEY